jgi:hypothetical protein
MMRWIGARTGVQRQSLPLLREEASGSGSPSRMSVPTKGWCGQHLPNNEHREPRPIDIKRLF